MLNSKALIPEVEIFEHPPKDFVSTIDVCCAFLEIQGKVLILERATTGKGTWGLPGGKLEEGESPEQTVRREFLEETQIALPDQMNTVGMLYFRRPKFEYIFHMFRATMPAFPEVVLNDEHTDFGWFSKNDIDTIPIMSGGREVFEFYWQYLDNLSENFGNHLDQIRGD